MAVQAQYPCNAMAPDLRNRTPREMLEELETLQRGENHGGGLLGLYADMFKPNNLGTLDVGTVLSGPQQSGLTSDASASRRKRSRGDALMPLPPNGQQVSRLLGSAGASTSGTPAFISAPPSMVSPVSYDVASHLCQQSMDVDALIRHESESLRLGLEEATKRHYVALLSVLEQRVAKRLMEKETQLQETIKRNAELEEKVRLMSSQSQFWFEAAKNSEALVSSLRASLEQALLHNAAGPAREEFGDTEAARYAADDALSCCFQGHDEQQEKELAYKNACKACEANDVCVLLLPCRHLCLCKDCEPKLEQCPICGSVKKASFRVFMS